MMMADMLGLARMGQGSYDSGGGDDRRAAGAVGAVYSSGLGVGMYNLIRYLIGG